MSFATTPAYTRHTNGWEESCREHPVYDWMWDYSEAFDKGDMKSKPYTDWNATDFAYTSPTGVDAGPGEASWAAQLEQYAPFAEHFHEPMWFIIYETPDGNGYELTGYARLYADLPVPGEKTKPDVSGRKWDVLGHGMFMFTFVKDKDGPKGLKMKSAKLFADGLPMVGEMMKRGMITPEDLMKKMG